MKVEIIATGPELIKRGIRGIEPILEEMINSAINEIQIMTYLLTPSSMHILELLEHAAEKGVKIILLVNNVKTQDECIVSRLRLLSEKFHHVKVMNFRDPEGKQLHAKVIVVDRKRAIVGSANLSWGGMYLNYEIGLFVEGEPAWQLAAIVDLLSHSASTLT
jgi:cardiolipin synthase